MIVDMLKSNLLAAAVIFLTIGLSRLLKNRYSVRWKSVVWLATALFLLVPVRFYAPDPVIEMRVPTQIYSHAQEPAVSDGTDGEARPAEQAEQGEPVRPPVSETQAVSGAAKLIFSVEDALHIFSVLWFCGAGIIAAVRVVRAGRGYKRLKMCRSLCVPAGYGEIYKKVCADMGLKKIPALYMCREAESPVLAGIFRPCLYLPDEPYSQTELIMIFLHELNHYRHRDLLFKLLLLAVKTIYWFNPALAVMSREADRDLESICDSRVIDCMEGKSGRTAYGRLLLRTASGSGAACGVSAGLNDGVAKFKERVMYMMKADQLKRGIPIAVLLIIFLVAANGLVGCSLGSSGQGSQSSAGGADGKPEFVYETGSSASSSSADKPSEDTSSASSSYAEEEMMASSSSIASSSYAEEEMMNTSSASSSSAEDAVASSSSSYSSAEEEMMNTSSASASYAEEEPSEFAYTPVQAQYRLYEVTYRDYRQFTGLEEIPEDVYEIAVSHVTGTSFDFSILQTDPAGKVLDTVIEKATAVFVGDGTEARYLDGEFDLVFLFPDNHGALPDVADIEVHGFQPMEGKLYLYNGIPGHEFS
jgi:beta-lactamase regulating signal transducer with metallopeptidase domain